LLLTNTNVAESFTQDPTAIIESADVVSVQRRSKDVIHWAAFVEGACEVHWKGAAVEDSTPTTLYKLILGLPESKRAQEKLRAVELAMDIIHHHP
jgi:hypothetical protein